MKKEIREKLIKKRDNILVDKRKLSDEKLIKNLEKLDIFNEAKKVFIYVNFKSEVNTKILIKKYLFNKRIFVPKIVNDKMKLIEIFSLEELEKGNFSLLEPKGNNYYSGTVDVVIVPGLSYDLKGYRMGYGKGYYDKYLAEGKYKNSIGLCYEEMLSEDLYSTLNDRNVDFIITDDRIIKSKKDNFIITTSVKKDKELENKAKNFAKKLGVKYIVREKNTISRFLKFYKNLFLVYKNKLIFLSEKGKFFFHLDTAMLRIKNKKEPILDIIGEKKQSILDATMGLCRDSIVLSYFGHELTALEKNKIVFEIVKDGMKNLEIEDEKIINAIKKIKLINIDNLEYLRQSPDNEYDIIYADFMFCKKIKNSDNLNSLEKIVKKSGMTEEFLTEAKRVARKKIIIKAHILDNIFQKFNFKRIRKSGAEFNYGVVELKKDKNEDNIKNI